MYVHDRENVRAGEKSEYPFNIHSRPPLSDLSVKIPFLKSSGLESNNVTGRVLPQWLKRRVTSTRQIETEKIAAFVSYCEMKGSFRI